MLILGLTGKAGAGKDTVADMIYSRRAGWYRLSFAGPIKLMLLESGLVSGASLANRLAKDRPLQPWGKSPRQLMQSLGTEWGRKLVHPDIWLLLLDQKVTNASEHGAGGVIITDVRFENEAEYVRDMGGRVVHIERALPGAADTHPSERGVKVAYGDLTIDNNGSVDELALRVETLLEVVS